MQGHGGSHRISENIGEPASENMQESGSLCSWSPNCAADPDTEATVMGSETAALILTMQPPPRTPDVAVTATGIHVPCPCFSVSFAEKSRAGLSAGLSRDGLWLNCKGGS